MPSPARLWLVFALIVLTAAALVLAWQRDLGWATLAEHAATLHRWVAAAPIATASLYSAVYAACVALSLPLSLWLTLLGGLLFGPVLGAVLATAASSTGAVLLFLLARGAL